jgi:hypothetical protein
MQVTTIITTHIGHTWLGLIGNVTDTTFFQSTNYVIFFSNELLPTCSAEQLTKMVVIFQFLND